MSRHRRKRDPTTAPREVGAAYRHTKVDTPRPDALWCSVCLQPWTPTHGCSIA